MVIGSPQLTRRLASERSIKGMRGGERRDGSMQSEEEEEDLISDRMVEVVWR